MKGPVLFAAWFILSAFGKAAGDVLFLKSGTQKSCQVVGLENGNIIIRSQPVPELPPIESRYPQNQISSIEFGRDPYLETLLQESAPTRAKELESLWSRFAPLLGFAGSPSSGIGLRLGRIYLESSDNLLLHQALNIFSQIANESSDLKDRESAQQGKLRAWLALGRGLDAAMEARRILSLPSGPNLRAEARLILADAMARELWQLLEDNPRWEEDEAAGRERLRLYNDALELYLLASLLPEITPHLAARALWGASAIHFKCNSPSLAAEAARDLITFFPDSAFAGNAADFLRTLPSEPQNNAEKELRQPVTRSIYDTTTNNNSYETQNPTVSPETTLDHSGSRPKRSKRNRDTSQ